MSGIPEISASASQIDIDQILDKIFEEYNVDKTGGLNKDQARKFMKGQLEMRGDELSDEDFDEFFTSYDKN